MLTGGCFCGAIRYEVHDTPFDETNCHCLICRRTTDVPFVTSFSVRSSNFRLIKGEPTQFNSTARGLRSFCSRYVTQLTFEHTDFPDEIDVTTGTLDDPELVPPCDNTRTSTRLRWVATDELPEDRDARQQG
jgi:hypothetical protein